MVPKTLYLVDISSYLFRAYYAIQSLKTSGGISTNATYGVINMLLKLIRDKKPDRLAIVFDSPTPTFRKEMYPDYKANRAQPPEDLPHQFDHIRQFTELYPLSSLQCPGFEADDVMAAVVNKFGDMQIVLVSGDKDLMQLIGPGVSMYDSMREKVITEKEVIEKFGVGPAQVIDVLALAGDASDNVPGVMGIGDKTASKLIADWKTLENLLDHAGEIKGKLGERLQTHRADALLSKKLVTLRTDLPLEFDSKKFVISDPDQSRLNEFYEKLELRTLIQHPKGEANPAENKRAAGRYELVLTQDALMRWKDKLIRAKAGFAFDTETTGLSPFRAELVGLSFSCMTGEACYIPVGHRYPGCPDQLPKKTVFETLGPLLEDAGLPKFAQNGKYDIEVLSQEEIRVVGLQGDSLIAAYLLNPEGAHNLDHLSQEHLGLTTLQFSEVVEKGKTFADVEVQTACRYSAEDADFTYRLIDVLHGNLKKENLWECYREIELPLVDVLFRMEKEGVFVDPKQLEVLSVEFGGRLVKLEKEIHQLAGVSFNVASPKQVADILFGKLNLPPQRKTKTGYSTDVDVLTVLAKIHPLPKFLLEHRLLSKLKSTYLDQLQALIHPKTGRIHTHYGQAIAATGRLISSDPNLQNIPIRTEEGRRIREAFRASKGFKILSADYSQIELRLLAAFSGDPNLVRAFEKGEDVHRMTAERIFSRGKEVTDKMRSMAKTVNFGILYGQGPFGLSQMLEIPVSEARKVIDDFYAEFPSVMKYKEEALAKARKMGEVRTWKGRRRLVPDINSKNNNLRQNAEREAFNTIFQGSAADLIKVAMIKIDEKIQGEGRGEGGAKMIMQVHDELVFEVPEGDVEKISALVTHEMEKAIPCVVPLKVDVGIGDNWADAH